MLEIREEKYMVYISILEGMHRRGKNDCLIRINELFHTFVKVNVILDNI